MVSRATSEAAEGSYYKTIPPDIVGVWEIPGESYRDEFTATGEFFVYDQWWPWGVSGDGQTLTYGVETWNRTFGSGQVLEGVWSAVDFPADWYLRADLTYTFHWLEGTGEEYFGRDEVSGGQMRTIEYRATVILQGNALTLDPPYGADTTGTWEVVGNELRIDVPNRADRLREGGAIGPRPPRRAPCHGTNSCARSARSPLSSR